MSVEVWILVATAAVAVVAIGAAVVAVRAVRRLSQAEEAHRATQPGPTPVVPPRPSRRPAEIVARESTRTNRPAELESHVVEGRLVVPPTQHQVLQTAMGRPGVRLSVVAHGVAHALRAESRDRIAALMRREYRRRRRERLQAGRRAVRAAQPTPRPTPPSDQWMGS